jgi:hypothetical protein
MRSLFLILFLLLSVPVTASPIEEGWHIEFETPSPFVGESYAQEFSVVLLTPIPVYVWTVSGGKKTISEFLSSPEFQRGCQFWLSF